ncbi:hypothetical protein FRC12_004302 [Ceratobasidium sp. 428]|nr:hypothetical protein FRC12_004302 [Ceratobasidium sp. 428]
MLFSRIIALVAVSAVTVAALPSPDNGTVSKPCDKHPRAVGEPVDAGIERRHDLAARRKGINPDLSSLPRHGHKARDAPAKDPFAVATEKLKAIKPEVADAMAGPKEERVGKLMVVADNVLAVLNDLNQSVGTGLPLFKLTDSATADKMNLLAKTVNRIMRSCKGQHSQELANKVTAITDVMSQIEPKVQGMTPMTESMLSGWSIGLGKMDIISKYLTSA